MKVMLDLNVLLDVIQHRQPHYADSARVIDTVIRKIIDGTIPAHGVTTLYFVASKHLPRKEAREMLAWLLQHFSIEPATRLSFQTALEADFTDYEDAVVHTLAESAGCDAIITRNVDDFEQSTIQIFTPTQFIRHLETLS